MNLTKYPVNIILAIVAVQLVYVLSVIFAHESKLLLAAGPAFIALPLAALLIRSERRPADQASATVDVSELRRQILELTERERLIADFSAEVLAIIAPTGTIVSVNPVCLFQWGFTRAELEGKSVSVVLMPQEQGKFDSMADKARADKAPASLDLTVKTKSQELRDFRFTLEWSASADAFFTLAQDITAAKQLERLKAEFLSMISHDLRAPLMSIGAAVDLFALGEYGHINLAGKDKLNVIQNNIGRLVQLTDDLIDIEKWESGNLTLRPRNAELDPIIAKAISAVADVSASRGIEIKCTASATTSVVVDEARLVQVLVNLLSNAIKFSPEDSVVRVETKNSPTGVQIRITDRGPGIPREFHQSIFERYKQVRLQDSEGRGGSGLGLAICKTFVELHGGEIGVISTPPYGSTFWVRLPPLTAERK